MKRLENKVAIVTGSSKGIGAGIAERFLEEGAKVVITARSEDVLKDTHDRLKSKGEIIHVSGDLSLPEVWEKIIDETVKAFGQIDILVNNCGVHNGGHADVTSLETWNTAIACNLTSYFLGIHYVVPLMKAKRSGAIVNVSSACGLQAGMPKTMPEVFSTPYTTTKHAIMGLNTAVAAEVAPFNIRCNAVNPGGTNTKMGAKLSDDAIKLIREDHPLPPHLNEIWDVANAVIFLCSDEARTITGAHLAVDCGQTLEG